MKSALQNQGKETHDRDRLSNIKIIKILLCTSQVSEPTCWNLTHNLSHLKGNVFPYLFSSVGPGAYPGEPAGNFLSHPRL